MERIIRAAEGFDEDCRVYEQIRYELGNFGKSSSFARSGGCHLRAGYRLIPPL